MGLIIDSSRGCHPCKHKAADDQRVTMSLSSGKDYWPLRPLIVENVSRKSALMTDEGGQYFHVGKEFARHEAVNHSADEYVRGDAYTNTAECRFSLMKRAVYGTHHSISEAHLPRYLTEWDFKWNTRQTTDGERTALIAKGIEGKRLTYRPTH